MKKLVTVIIILALAISTISTAYARTAYDPEKDQFVVVGYDEEKQEVYTTVVSYKTVVRLVKNNSVCAVYLFEVDALVEISWTVTDAGTVEFTNTITGETF